MEASFQGKDALYEILNICKTGLSSGIDHLFGIRCILELLILETFFFIFEKKNFLNSEMIIIQKLL